MDSWRFVHVADMQPGSPKSFRYLPQLTENWRAAQRQIRAAAPEVLLVGGDLTRDGNVHRFELEEMRADLDGLGVPYRVVPGNMDTGNKHIRVAGCHRRNPQQYDDVGLNVTSAQLRNFAEVFGPLQWSFDHRGVRFSGFTDMVVNSGLPEEDAFWRWAEEQARRPRARHHVWVMHYALFVERPDEPDWDPTQPEHYHDWYFSVDQPGRGRLMDLFQSTGATLVISGHIHCRRALMADGIRFDYAPATSFGQWAGRWPDGDPALGFMVYTVSADGITGRFEPLREVVQAAGEPYGVGGHPLPAARDYGMAWDPSYARTLNGRVPTLQDA